MNDTIKLMKDKFGEVISGIEGSEKTHTISIQKESLIKFLRYLKNELGFSMLIDLHAVHYPKKQNHFELIYNLYSIEKTDRILLKISFNEIEPHIPSITNIWESANWFEREAFDLFGIVFDGHPNLKRILTFEGFEGHPLRKDYKKEQRQNLPKSAKLV